MYLSRASDYLRSQQSVYIGSLTGGTTTGEKTRVQAGNLPYVLAPTPRAGDEPRFEALYVPSGKALWAAVEEATPNDQATSAPLIGVQGGFY